MNKATGTRWDVALEAIEDFEDSRASLWRWGRNDARLAFQQLRRPPETLARTGTQFVG
jgi:hypothetical protein